MSGGKSRVGLIVNAQPCALRACVEVHILVLEFVQTAYRKQRSYPQVDACSLPAQSPTNQHSLVPSGNKNLSPHGCQADLIGPTGMGVELKRLDRGPAFGVVGPRIATAGNRECATLNNQLFLQPREEHVTLAPAGQVTGK